MCTALTLETKEGTHLFGRNIDIDDSFQVTGIFVPRAYMYHNKVIHTKHTTKYAMIGMGRVIEDSLVLVDALNEKGLACAVLDLPCYTSWNSQLIEGKTNLSPCEVTAWIVSNFGTLEEVKLGLRNINIVGKSVMEGIATGETHWMVADKTGKSIVIEKTKDHLRVYNNKVGVLTNAPTFDWQITNLSRYMKLKPEQPSEVKWGEQVLKPYSGGFGGIGLPGDSSSPSRFVKAAFLRNYTEIGKDEMSALSAMYHILDATAVVKGTVINDQNEQYYTQCTTCMCLEKGIYYYNTYDNNQITAIDLFQEDFNRPDLKVFPYRDKLTIYNENFTL